MSEEREKRFEAEIRRQLEEAGTLPPRRWSREKAQGVWEDPRYLLDGRRMDESRG